MLDKAPYGDLPDRLLNAQAELQTALGLLRLNGVDAHIEMRLQASLAMQHELLAEMGRPMYRPTRMPEGWTTAEASHAAPASSTQREGDNEMAPSVNEAAFALVGRIEEAAADGRLPAILNFGVLAPEHPLYSVSAAMQAVTEALRRAR